MKKYILYITLFFSATSLAQIEQGNTTVNRAEDFEQQSVTVERNYEPKVEAAEKIKQTPAIESTETEKLHVDYALKDVEAESDFETSTIGAEELPVEDQAPLNNYIRAGYGNRGTLKLDGFGEYALESDRKVGANLEYFSTNGEMPDIILDTNNSRLAAEGFFKMNFDQSKADIRLGGSFHKLNYYGVGLSNEDIVNQGIDDVSQRYSHLYTAAKFQMYQHLFLDEISFKAGFFGDKYDAGETNLDLNARFSNANLADLNILNDLNLGASADVNLNFANTKFEQLFDAKFSSFTFGVAPMIHFSNDLLQLKAGLNIQFDSESESGESDFYLFPKAEVFVTAIPEFGLYGGITGGVNQNRFQTLYNKNPYLLPNQLLKSTVEKMEIYVGVRGDIGTDFKYDASAAYSDLDNNPFFSKFHAFGQAFMQANSFSVIYDDGKRTRLQANVNYLGVSNLDLGASLMFQSYSLDNLEEAWGEPGLKASINADYKFMDDRLIIGGDLFVLGNRKATQHDHMLFGLVETENLPSYDLKTVLDLNVNATYLITEQWAAFAEIHNALNNNYDRFLDYPVNGITAMGGVMFKF